MKKARDHILCGTCWNRLGPKQAKCLVCGTVHDLSILPMGEYVPEAERLLSRGVLQLPTEIEE